MRGVRGSLAAAVVVAVGVGASAVAGAAGCGGGSGGEGPLLRALGDEVDLVVLATPAEVGPTWAARATTLLVPGLPACVRERAMAADAVAATWSQRGGTEGDWALIMNGGGAAGGCEGLERAGALAWYGPDPRRGDRRFFAAGDRKRRWRALGSAPVRALGDIEVQPGIIVHAAGTLDPRDGVDARATLRFDERAAADGFEELRERFASRLDRHRLGGAWPAFGATLERDPRDPSGATLVGALRLPGKSGEEAVVFAINAYLAGDLGAPAAPCPSIADAWQGQIECSGRQIVIGRALFREILANPSMLGDDVRVVPNMRHGTSQGLTLFAIRPTSLAAALGMKNGDRILALGGRSTATLEQAAHALEGVRHETRFTVELVRHGDNVSLRYEIR